MMVEDIRQPFRFADALFFLCLYVSQGKCNAQYLRVAVRQLCS